MSALTTGPLPTRPGRIRCEAVGCRRTADASKYPARTIIICGKCWRCAPRAQRAAFKAAQKEVDRLDRKADRHDRMGWPIFPDAETGIAFCAAYEAKDSAWAQILVEINEARGGLS